MNATPRAALRCSIAAGLAEAGRGAAPAAALRSRAQSLPVSVRRFFL